MLLLIFLVAARAFVLMLGGWPKKWIQERETWAEGVGRGKAQGGGVEDGARKRVARQGDSRGWDLFSRWVVGWCAWVPRQGLKTFWDVSASVMCGE